MESIVTEKIRERVDLKKEDDWLGFYNIADYLLKYILNKEFPVSVGIYGKWGSGKSVFVNFLKNHANNNDLNVIEFDAIKNINNLQDEIISKIKVKNASIFIIAIIISVAFILIGYYFFVDNKHPFLGTIFSSIGLINVVNFPFKIKKDSKIIGKIKNYSAKIFFPFSGKNLVIIDNLDRLSPKKSIAFLEKLKSYLLLNNSSYYSNNFAYVIPCDFDILKNEIRKLYGNDNLDARDYLNKLIEIPFYLPLSESERREGLIKSLLNPELKESIRAKLIQILKSFLFETPRDIKLFLLELDMIFIVAKARKVEREEYLISNLPAILILQLLRAKFKELFMDMKKNYIAYSGGSRRLTITPFVKKDEDDFNSKIQEKFDGSVELLKISGIIGEYSDSFPVYFNGELFHKILIVLESSAQRYTIPQEKGGGIGVSSIGSSAIGA